ncbi:hypothetical protein ACFE04_014442 [Oxalis oulophora]
MLALEELLYELTREDFNELGLPPGFRFHPTDEELITFYLASKVFNGNFCGFNIAEVDLNRCEPWELPDVAKMGEKEWYFYSVRDRKYPTGLRTNRATVAGYWKATGKDREVYSATTGALLGMKKTLVFYKGRAPRGLKTKWVMHEYRLDGDFSYRHTCKEEWVICRIFHKSGDKKNGTNNILLQDEEQCYTINEEPPNNSSTLDPFQIQIQNRKQHDDHDELIKTLILNPIMNKNQSHYLFSNNNTSSVPSSMLFKSRQQQNIHHGHGPVQKQCKTESNNFSSSHFELPGASSSTDHELNWMEKILTTYQNPNPYVFESNGSCLLGFSSANATLVVSDMSTSTVDHNRVGFQMMAVDPPPMGESWP